MRAPLISVVMPAYNERPRIARAIESVRAQTIDDWELLIADDGSTDATAEEARRAAGDDPRIRVLSLSNGGVSRARNAAIALARGPLLALHDADDWLDPRHFELLSADLAATPEAAVAACSYAATRDDGSVITTFTTPHLPDPFLAFSRTCVFPVHAALTRTATVRAVGGFDETLRGGEDWDLWLRIARTGAAMFVRRDVLAFYRQRDGSTTRRADLMIRALAQVIPRAFAADSRVPEPAPDYALGAPRSDLADAVMDPVFFNVGIALANEEPLDAIWAELPDLRDWRFDAALASHGLIAGLRHARPELGAAGWPSLAAGLMRARDGLAERQGHARDADLLRAHVEARLRGPHAFADGFSSRHVQTTTHAVDGRTSLTIDADESPVCVVALHRAGAACGSLEFPTAIAAQPDAVDAALAAAARELSPAAGDWRACLQRPIASAALIASRIAGHRPGRTIIREAFDAAVARARSARWSSPARRGPDAGKGAACLMVPILTPNQFDTAAIDAALDALEAADFTPIALPRWAAALHSGLAPRGRRFALCLHARDIRADDPLLERLASRAIPLTLFMRLEGAAPGDGWTWAQARAWTGRGINFGWRVPRTFADDAAALATARAALRAFTAELPMSDVCAHIEPGCASRFQAEILRAAGFSAALGRRIGRSHIDEPAFDLRRAPIASGATPQQIVAIAQQL